MLVLGVSFSLLRFVSPLNKTCLIKFLFKIPEGLSAYFECVRGVSIHKLLQEYGAFVEPVIQNYTLQILSCLAYLFGQNIVHRWPLSLNSYYMLPYYERSWHLKFLSHLCRDIKGANILVDMNGEIRFTEFGMAMKVRIIFLTLLLIARQIIPAQLHALESWT